MERKKLIEESITREISEVNPVVAIPYASSVYSISLTKGPKWLFTGGEDGLIRKFDFFKSVEGKSLLTVSQRHQLIDSILFNGMICSYWENEIPYYKSDLSGKTGSSSISSNSSSTVKKKNSSTDMNSFFEPNLSPVYSLCADQNGFWLLSGLQNGAITLQSVRSSEGTIQWYFKNANDKSVSNEEKAYHHSNSVSCIITNSDQTNFLSGSWDRKILKWDLNTGKNMNSFNKSTGQVSALQYRPIIGTDMHWEPKNDEEDDGDDDDDDMGSLFDDDDDDEEEAKAKKEKDNDNDKSGRREDANEQTGEPKEKLASQDPHVKRDILKLQRESLQTGTYEGLRASDDIFLSSSIDGCISIWDARLSPKTNNVEKIPVPSSTPPWCMSATWSVDGDSIFVGRRNSTIEEYDIRYPSKVSKLMKFPSASGSISCVRTLPTRNYLLCGCQDNIRLYDLRLYEAPGGTTGSGTSSRKVSRIPFTIVPGHNGGILSDLYVDPTCRFMVSASGNRGWQGKPSDYVFIYELM